MTKARRIEGPCAPLFYSAAAMLLLFGKITTAQPVDLSTLERCAGLETPELKLACFEAIIANENSPRIQAAEAVEVPVVDEPAAEVTAAAPELAAAIDEAPAVVVVPESPPAVAAGPASAVVTPKPAPAAAETSVPEQLIAAVDEAPEVAPAATVAVTSEPPAASDFGQEYLDRTEKKDEEPENEILRATVIEVTRDHNKVLYFHLDNGHVWRQMEVRHFQYPKNDEFDINITRGMMGEYRMRIGDDGRLVRIRRVK